MDPLHLLFKVPTRAYSLLYNNEGKPDKHSQQNFFYFGEPTEFVDTLEAWRADGKMKGLELR